MEDEIWNSFILIFEVGKENWDYFFLSLSWNYLPFCSPLSFSSLTEKYLHTSSHTHAYSNPTPHLSLFLFLMDMIRAAVAERTEQGQNRGRGAAAADFTARSYLMISPSPLSLDSSNPFHTHITSHSSQTPKPIHWATPPFKSPPPSLSLTHMKWWSSELKTWNLSCHGRFVPLFLAVLTMGISWSQVPLLHVFLC